MQEAPKKKKKTQAEKVESKTKLTPGLIIFKSWKKKLKKKVLNTVRQKDTIIYRITKINILSYH